MLPATAFITALAAFEIKTSYFLSGYLHSFSKQINFKLQSDKVDDPFFPKFGPLNERYGYTKIPTWTDNLKNLFTITHQADLSTKHKQIVAAGLNPIYNPKPFSQFKIDDQYGNLVYKKEALFFNSLEDVPPIIISILTFIENREILQTNFSYANPVVEVDRLAQAGFLYIKNQITGSGGKTAGGSTLATQMEKYNFSKDGKTQGSTDKIKQIASASLRVYKDSRSTLNQRKKILLDYINSVPLGAANYYGEVRGLAEGLSIIYNVNLNSEIEVLNTITNKNPYNRQQLESLNRLMQLILSIRNPNFLKNPQELKYLKQVYVQTLIKQNILNSSASNIIQMYEEKQGYKIPDKNFITQKAQDHLRSRIAQLLKVTYSQLDKLDLSVQSTLDYQLQQQITQFFENLKDENFIKQNSLRQEKLLDNTDKDKVTYSFILYELVNGSANLRATYDNINKPFEFNSGGKVELGSTAKLRVIISYLEAFVEAYNEKKLEKLTSNDQISTFVRSSNAQSLDELLTLALDRKFSANPNELFFTGGGAHKFSNYKKEDNLQVVSIREALKRSINLPFVRALKEVVQFKIHRNSNYQKLLQSNQEVRQKLLERFVEQESSIFLKKFYKTLKIQKNIFNFLVKELTTNYVAATAVIVYLKQIDSTQQLLEQLHLFGYTLNLKQQKRAEEILKNFQKGIYNINDLGYLARLHPILLFAAKVMQDNSNISYDELFKKSYQTRMLSYKWLLDTKYTNRQNTRIYSILEAQAFEEILKDWNKLGYDFDYIVPSLATALGSSGDKPIYLARLIGTIINNGKSIDEHRITKLHFAEKTPYETILERIPQPSTQLITPEVSSHVRAVLDSVVDGGTAVRAKNSFGNLKVGGKTGTGDNRLETFDSTGKVLNSSPLNRTATFVFHIGNNWFGSMTVYVDQDQADQSSFTSSLAVTIFNLLAEKIKPIILTSNLKEQIDEK